jgi:4-amino-4-deoxy-L-arabinose transferase-like glycosyltransferase
MMETAVSTGPDVAEPTETAAPPVWRVGWLTPARCRVILAVVLTYGFVSHLWYLRHDCPIDLSGDEAQYWEWSRNLDWSYYSKGPLVAYIIRASCAVFGDVMWAVRLPALALGVGTSILTYLFTRKLFGSDRLALGVVLLFHIVPMFIAGSVLMTIDPPFFFCWALATCLLAHAVFDGRKWLWPLIGMVVGVGFLAKYAMFLWLFAGAIPFLAFDVAGRRHLRSWKFWSGVIVALGFTAPVLIWNAKHGWVSARHVSTQTGTGGEGRFDPLNGLAFLAGQAGVIGPLVVFMVGGVAYAIRHRRVEENAALASQKRSRGIFWMSPFSEARRLSFLLWIGLPFFVLVTAVAIVAKVQINWPAPAYFTGMILTGYFISTRLRARATWKPWRPWFWTAVVFGVVMMPVIHDFEVVYPWIARYNQWRVEAAKAKGVTDPAELAKVGLRSMRDVDPMAKLKGWEELGRHVGEQLKLLRPGAIVMGEDYQYAAQMGFYIPGQPRAFCAGSFFVTRPKRSSQFDMWKDRSLDPAENPSVLGKDAVYVGWPRPDLWRAFDAVEELPPLQIERGGLFVRQFRVYRCYNFHGMKRNVKSF